MLRWVLLVFVLAGSAAAEPAGPEDLRGCWVEHGALGKTTLSWAPDPDHAGDWRVDSVRRLVELREPVAGSARVARVGGGWTWCEEDGPCVPAVFGSASSPPADRWYEFHLVSGRLHFDFKGPRGSLTIINAARGDCE